MARRNAVNPRSTRRQDILDAALDLFARHGYSGTGIDDIGAAVDITGQGVYRHFSSKEEILIEAFEEAGKLMVDALAQSKQQRPALALNTLVKAHATMAVRHASWIQIWSHEGHNLPKRWSGQSKNLQVRYVDWFAHVIGELRPDLTEPECTEMVHAIIGALNSGSTYASAMADDRRIEYLVHCVKAFVRTAPNAEGAKPRRSRPRTQKATVA